MKVKKELIIVLLVLLFVISLVNVGLLGKNTELVGAATQDSRAAVAICINRTPTITAIADSNATVGTAFTLQVVATDNNSDSLTFYDNTSLFNINSSGYISFTPASGNVGNTSILITVQDSSSCRNQNATDVFFLDVVGTGATTTPAPAEGATGAAGAGGGGGGALPEPNPSFTLSDATLKATVKTGSSAQKALIITNDGDVGLSISIVNPLSVLGLSPSSFVLTPGESQEVILVINPNNIAQAGIYTGSLIVTGGGIEKSVLIVIGVESEKIIFDGSIDLEEKNLYAGDELRALITLTGQLPGEVTVLYTITNSNGGSIYQEEEVVSVTNQVSFTKVFPLSEDLTPGKYVFGLHIKYPDPVSGDESYATSTEIFNILAPPASLAGFAAQSTSGPVLLWVIPTIIILIILILVVLYVLHRRVGKRRVVRHIVERKVVTRKKYVDVGSHKRKLAALKEGYQKGFIKKSTYHRSKKKIEEAMGKR